MNRSWPVCVPLVLCVSTALFLTSLEVRGQEAPAQPSFAEQVSVSWVLVPVIVEGRRGPITDLESADFELFVDGTPTPIGSFESGSDLPFSLFFLQDLSGSMELVGRLDSSRRVLDYFLDRARSGDRFALFSFAGERVTLSVPLTADVKELKAAAAAWEPYGTTALHDAIAWLPRFIVDRPSTRRAVLLLSDGLDNASSITASAARHQVRASEIPVYVIGLETGSPYEFTASGDKRNRYADVMNLLAHLTGGRYHSVATTEDLDAAAATILEDLRHQYILGFPTGGDGGSALRSIEVRVKRKKAQVSHRRGYEGPPPIGRRP